MKQNPKIIVGIGASAGGIPAISEILERLPADTDMAFILVLHLDPNFKSSLAEIFGKKTKMPVSEIVEPLHLEANCVYIISPNTKISIVDGIVEPSPRKRSDGLPKPIDHLLKTLGKIHGPEAIGIILTGSGIDGSSGITSIKEFGGLTIAQDPSEALHSSMPQSAIETGCIDLTLPLEKISSELARLSGSPFGEKTTNTLETLSAKDKAAINEILEVIYSAKGVSFVNYKQTTIYRRIQRRMAITRNPSISSYTENVKESPSEQRALFEDLLIKVTQFFRDREVFKNLTDNIFPKLWRKDLKRDALRIWVPACASGEEVYSLAIVVLEYFEFSAKTKFHFFGTDLSKVAVDHARKGWFPKSIESEVSKERLSQFFTKVEDGYQVSQVLRDMCVFSLHDIARDPPFAHIDFLSCRNLLIYFDQELQKKVIPLFHYSLNSQGLLMLGPAETLHQQEELFEPLDIESKIYRKLASTTPRLAQFFPAKINASHLEELKSESGKAETKPSNLIDQAELVRKADDIVLRYLSPPGFLINGALDVIQYRGNTSSLIAPSHGLSSLNILKLVRSDLIATLKEMLRDFDRKGPIKSSSLIHFECEGEAKSIRIRVTPIFTKHTSDHYSIVTFHNENPSPIQPYTQVKAEPEQDDHKNIKIFELERQLFESKELLREANDKQEATYEELKAANEEILSSNEELQSTNEELEASKEELQSSNEELSTVNEELHKRNETLNSANDDLRNLLEFSQVATIMLGRDLKIRRFTPEAEKLFRLLKNDVGRPLSHLNPIFKLPDLEERVIRVIDKMQSEEVEIEIPSLGNKYALEIRPYRTGDFQIAGALIGLNEISSKRRIAIRRESDLVSSNISLRGVFDTLEQPILVLDHDLTIALVNRSFCRQFHVGRDNLLGQKIYEIDKPFYISSEFRVLLENIVPGKQNLSNFKLDPVSDDLKQPLLVSGHELIDGETEKNQIMLAFRFDEAATVPSAKK